MFHDLRTRSKLTKKTHSGAVVEWGKDAEGGRGCAGGSGHTKKKYSDGGVEVERMQNGIWAV